MSYNFEKKMNSDARKAAKTTFNLFGALLGLALGAKPFSGGSRRSGYRSYRSSGFSRRRRW